MIVEAAYSQLDMVGCVGAPTRRRPRAAHCCRCLGVIAALASITLNLLMSTAALAVVIRVTSHGSDDVICTLVSSLLCYDRTSDHCPATTTSEPSDVRGLVAPLQVSNLNYMFTSPLRELTCHMRSHSVTCHPAEVTFPPLPQPINAGTRLSDPRRIQG